MAIDTNWEEHVNGDVYYLQSVRSQRVLTVQNDIYLDNRPLRYATFGTCAKTTLCQFTRENMANKNKKTKLKKAIEIY